LTVSTIDSTIDYVGNGVTTAFTVPFRFLSNSDLVVTLTAVDGTTTTPALGTDYTVVGAGAQAGGAVMMTTAPVAGAALNVSRVLAAVQETDLRNQGRFYAETHENVFDYLTMLIQQGFSTYNRALQRPIGKNYYDAMGRIISNIADGVSSQDAVNVRSMRSYVDQAIAGVTGGFGSFIQNFSGAVSRTFQDKMRDVISVKDFGAASDGVASAIPALLSANSAGVPVLYFPPGNYLVSSSISLNMPVVMQPGSAFIVPNGVTLTFSSSFNALIGKVFACSGNGKVVFNTAKTSIGYPEWWGAVTNDSSQNCQPSLTACDIALPVTKLQGADYWITSTFSRTTHNRTLQGVSSFYVSSGAGATRIVINSPTAHGITMGVPGLIINNFAQGQQIYDVAIVRAVAITAPAAGAELTGPTGLHVEGALNYKIERVTTEEHYVGMYIGGTCQGRIDDVKNLRSIPAANAASGNDKFFGIAFDGTIAINAAGGNASVFTSRPISVCYNVPMAYGYFAQGSFVDTFLDFPESSNCAYGAYLFGVGTASATQVAGNVDFHINQPVFDAYSIAGLWVQNLSPYGAIDVIGGYACPGSSAASGSVIFTGSNGLAKVLGMQHVGYTQPTIPGFVILNSSGVTLDTISQESLQPVILDGATFNDVRVSAKRQGAATATAAAITLRNTSTRNGVRPIVTGKSGAFTCGIELIAATNTSNELNCTGINPSATTSGYKLVINSTAVTTAGLTGTNLASGVMV